MGKLEGYRGETLGYINGEIVGFDGIMIANGIPEGNIGYIDTNTEGFNDLCTVGKALLGVTE